MVFNKALRTLYYDSVLKDSAKTKKMWDNVNLIINKKRPSSNIDNLKVKEKDLQHPSSISNAINRYMYFCNVPTELASKLPKADRHYSANMKRKKSTFRFAQVNETEVYLLLESIDTKKYFGYDNVHPLLLSSAALEIFRPLTHIINCHLNMAYLT